VKTNQGVYEIRETFTQNGCYGNSHTLFEVVFYSIDALLASFTKLEYDFPNNHIV